MRSAEQLTSDDQRAEATAKALEQARREGFPLSGSAKHPGAIWRAAQILGEPYQTVRHRLKRAGALRDGSPEAAPQPAPEIPRPVWERRTIQLEDENRELRRKNAELLLASIADEALRQILGGIVAAPASPPPWLVEQRRGAGSDMEVPVSIWSDWHAGEVVSRHATNGVNEFSMDVLERRVRRLVERTIDLCKHHGPGRYPGIVINLIGDFLSGALHPELLATDELELIPTSLKVRDLLVWALNHMLDAFGFIYCPCASGNHGRSTPKPELKRYVFKNFDWLIYQLLARHFGNDKRIVFDIPESNEVRYRIFGQRYLAMHGDMLGVAGGDGIIGAIGPIMRGETKVGKQSAAIGLDYDVLVIGHWHQPLFLNRIIVNNALKGFDEYAMLKLRAPPSVPSQALWFVHPKWGRTAHREIFLEDPALDRSAPWVSFRGAEAGDPQLKRAARTRRSA